MFGYLKLELELELAQLLGVGTMHWSSTAERIPSLCSAVTAAARPLGYGLCGMRARTGESQ